MADTTLQAIKTKVRRLTRSPSPNQLSEAELLQYINTAVLYDLPQHLRLNTLLTNITWYTQAYRDTYYVDQSLPITDPLYDFENKYITIDAPVYISGNRVFYTQSRDVFFGGFPQNNMIENFAQGNGAATIFTGIFDNFPVNQNSVIFSAIVANNSTLTYIDVPVLGRVDVGNLVNASTAVPRGTINYITGAYLIDFEQVPLANTNVVRQSLPYTPSPPTSLLYSNLGRIDPITKKVINNKVFTVRPIPDGAYPVNLQAFRLPAELLESGDSPELNQWWQYISYLAAKKVFDDRLDLESIQQIMPELKVQEALVLSKKVVQNTTQRAATIYSAQLENNPFFGTWGQWFGPIG